MASYRFPKGAYFRNTSDWFQLRQCYATGLADFTSSSPLIVGATQTNTNTCAVPAGTRVNDLLLACFNAASNSEPPSPGSWTLLQNAPTGVLNYWWWKYAKTSDPSSFTSTNSSSITGGNIVTVRGAAIGSSNPFDVVQGGSPNTNPMPSAAITGTSSEPELLLLQLGTIIFNKWNNTPGYTELANISDTVSGNSPGLALAATTGTGTIPSVSTSFQQLFLATSTYQQALIARASFLPYAALYNNATDGSVLYVTGIEVDFDAADQLTVSIQSGADTVPYALPYGVFPKNPLVANPTGILYSSPASNLVGYLYQSPKTLTHFELFPPAGDYVAVLPPGYALAVTNGNFGAKVMSSYFDYITLPSST